MSVVAHCRNSLIAGPLRLDGFDVRVGAIGDGRSARELLGAQDVVINCAVDAGWITTSRTANRDLLKALYEIPTLSKLVLFSSVGVYGNCIDRERSAFARPRPGARYAAEKLDLERSATRLERATVKSFVLRMGHVYGPYQWLSRAIFDLFAEPNFRLPFNGDLASNAVHIGSVCRAVESLVREDVPGGTYNLVDRPQRTWRVLADWHAQAAGVSPLGGLDANESISWTRRYRRAESLPMGLQLAMEFGAWLKSLPSFFAASPTALAIGPRLLGMLASTELEARLRAAYATIRASNGMPVTTYPVPPWLLSDEIPGPVVPYTSVPLTADDRRSVAAWYAGYSTPPSLLDPPLGAIE